MVSKLSPGLSFALAAIGLMTPAAVAQQAIVRLDVEGTARLPAAAVIARSGLRVGQTVMRRDLDGAAQKLLDTGFFSAVNYRYATKPAGSAAGYAVTLQVKEEPARTPALLDIPGLDEERLWQQLKSTDGLIDRQMPDNERVTEYYKQAIEAVLRSSNRAEEIVVKTEADLKTGKTVTIFRPAHLPKIAAIHFEGNQAVATPVLEAALEKVAIGQEYTERLFHHMLESNLRPLYEDLGRLTVAFPLVRAASMSDAAVSITAQINEGPVWRLGKVALNGEALPVGEMREAAQFAEGAPANWKQLLTSIQKMEQVLKREGYIAVSAKPVRSFHDSTQVVDVAVEVSKGRQFRFGELQIDGLDPEDRQRLARLWKLPGGAVMNELYIGEFLHAVLVALPGKFKTVRSSLHPRPGTNVVDVTITFR